MGYTTYFRGGVEVSPALPDELFEEISDFVTQRHEPDEEGTPGYWCDWILVPDGQVTRIEWNESEKFYDSAEWMAYLIEQKILPHGNFVINGEIQAQGEDPDDRWILSVRQNRTYVLQGRVAYQDPAQVTFHPQANEDHEDLPDEEF